MSWGKDDNDTFGKNINTDFGDTDGYNTDPQITNAPIEKSGGGGGFAKWSPYMFQTISDVSGQYFASRGGYGYAGSYGGGTTDSQGESRMLMYIVGAVIILGLLFIFLGGRGKSKTVIKQKIK